MEAVMMHGSFDQSISPYKSHLRNPKKIHENQAGLLQPPPPPFLSQSYPPYTLQKSSQPPLLPLPTAAPRRSAVARGLSANKKTSNPNKTRDPSVTPKKSKSPKKEEKNSPKKWMTTPKDVDSNLRSVVGGEAVDMFSGSAVFTFSPPPSSLPLPSFSMRAKLHGCKAEGIDAGATDDLRRLLRLR